MKKFFQNYGYKLATGSLFTGVGLSFLPEKLCPEIYQLIDGFYVAAEGDLQAKIPLPVPQHLQQLVGEEVQKCQSGIAHGDFAGKWTPYFTRSIFSPCGRGSIKTGAVIGLPFNYKFHLDAEDVPVEGGTPSTSARSLERLMTAFGFQFQSYAVADALTKTLLLSDDAKRYAVARALHELTYDSFQWKSAALCCGAASGAFLWQMASWSMDLKKSRAVSRGVGFISVGVALMNFVILRGLVINHAEKQADRKCVSMGQNYVKGGFEFYEKSVARNKMLHAMDVEDFNAYGNETTLYTMKMRTVNRYDHFKDCCREMTETGVL